jgi:uncharacterized membrane protein
LLGKVSAVTTAQGWTLIGIVLALLTALCTMTVHLVRVEFASLRSAMTTRFDVLDRDVQRLYERLFDRHADE